MPMHDWTRVKAGTYHDFHCRWLAEITNHLNRGVLPSDHYAQVEQVMGGMIADIPTLHFNEPHEEPDDTGDGGLAVAVAPPRVRITDSIEADQYAAQAKQIAIRHSSDDRIVALIEVLSPGNKSSDFALRAFVDKALEALRQNCHLLLIDPFPPSPRDPRGIHGAVWEELGGAYDPPPDKPLTQVAYAAGLRKTAYVEPFAVGDVLTAMPLLLTSERYVPIPLEETYTNTFLGVPRRWRQVLESVA
jgi:hypothetical protein